MIVIKKIFIGCIIAIILIPLFLFNFKSESESEIDNRYLTEIPIGRSVSDYSNEWGNYLSDRIGLRDQGISEYTKLNDLVFNQMEHPTYQYGKEGWVFFKLNGEAENYEYLDIFVDFVCQMQEFCKRKGIPFVFVLEPAKTTIYQQWLPDGYEYKNENLKYLVKKLKNKNVNFVDNVSLLSEKSKEDLVFNKKYDAGHWNELGSYYGVNNILKKLSYSLPDVKENSKSMFDISKKNEASLPVSQFIINEEVPSFTLKQKIDDNYTDVSSDVIDNLKIDSDFSTFFNYKSIDENDQRERVLFFQGSYLNKYYKFIYPAFREYIGIHAYQNVINFDEYIDQFNPDCIVFETAEYVFTDEYYDSQKMMQKTEMLREMMGEN